MVNSDNSMRQPSKKGRKRSYGKGSRDLVWQLIEVLLKARGRSDSLYIDKGKGKFKIFYCNWNGTGKPYLDVGQATVKGLATSSRLTEENVKTALDYLKNHLGILEDKRKENGIPERGYGSENRFFRLTLSSTDLEETKQKFYRLWEEKRPNHQAETEVADKGFEPRPFVRSLCEENDWVGRKALITELLRKLQEKTRLLWITGISGVGKTALAECLTSKIQNPDVSFHRISFETERLF
jgi:Effector-associated domain 4